MVQRGADEDEGAHANGWALRLGVEVAAPTPVGVRRQHGVREGVGPGGAGGPRASSREHGAQGQKERIRRSTRSSWDWNGSLQRMVSRSGSFNFRYTQSTR